MGKQWGLLLFVVSIISAGKVLAGIMDNRQVHNAISVTGLTLVVLLGFLK